MLFIQKISWLLKHEIRLSFRQQKFYFGKFAQFYSVTAFFLLYASLHLVIFPLNTLVTSLVSIENFPGILITFLALTLAFNAIPFAIDLFSSRNDSQLIVASPFSLKSVMVSRLLIIAVNVSIIPILIITPFFNYFIFDGNLSFISVYPTIFFMSVVMSTACVLLLLVSVRLLGVDNTKLIINYFGLVLVLLYVLTNLLNESAILSLPQYLNIFSKMNWLGSSLFGNLMPVALIGLSSIALLGISVRYFLSPYLTLLIREESKPSDRGSGRKTNFVDGKIWAIFLKEWRILLRDTDFKLKLLRIFVVIGITVVFFLRNNEVPYVIAPAVIVCLSVIANEICWQIFSNDQFKELLSLAPLSQFQIQKFKAFAVAIPPMFILLFLSILMIKFTIWHSLLLFIFGVISILNTCIINAWFSFRSLNSIKLGERPKQNLLALILIAGSTLSISWVTYILALNLTSQSLMQ